MKKIQFQFLKIMLKRLRIKFPYNNLILDSKLLGNTVKSQN